MLFVFIHTVNITFYIVYVNITRYIHTVNFDHDLFTVVDKRFPSHNFFCFLFCLNQIATNVEQNKTHNTCILKYSTKSRRQNGDRKRLSNF